MKDSLSRSGCFFIVSITSFVNSDTPVQRIVSKRCSSSGLEKWDEREANDATSRFATAKQRRQRRRHSKSQKTTVLAFTEKAGLAELLLGER